MILNWTMCLGRRGLAWIAGEAYAPKVKGGFMGKAWDAWVPGPEVWRECLRVLKPGGHLLAFAGTRSMDLMCMAIRIAGLELRDAIGHAHDGGSAPLLSWVYGSGYPKAKGALKPAWEPIVLARKPFKGSEAANVAAHGTGVLNIEACRIPGESTTRVQGESEIGYYGGNFQPGLVTGSDAGRWPANVVLDGSETVVGMFPANAGAAAPVSGLEPGLASTGQVTGERARVPGAYHADSGSAARFFYSGKASRTDRHEGLEDPGHQFQHGTTLRKVENAPKAGNHHSTVKPTALMGWLCTLACPPGGLILDPFMGSGSTGKAAVRAGFDFVGIEKEPEYLEISRARINHALESIRGKQLELI